MSYASELFHGKLTAAQFLGKSVAYFKAKFGLTVSDDAADRAADAATDLADAVEKLVVAYITANAPGLPAVIGTSIATSVLAQVDTAIAAATNIVKDNN